MTDRAAPSGARFAAPGPGGALLAGAARVALALAGTSSVPAARRLGPPRYATLERGIARLAWRALGADLRVTGLDHARGGPFVVLPLHESLVDPLLVTTLPLPLRFIARDELWAWPHVGDLLRAGGHLSVPLHADAGVARSVLRRAAEVTHRGDSPVIFPQGSILGIEVAFNRGGFWLARQLGLPVLPVVLVGTHRVWEHPYSPRLRRGCPVSLHVLEPVPAAQAWRGAAEIEEHMRSLALADRHAPPRRFVPERDGYWDGYPYEIAPEFTELAGAVARHRRAVGGDPDERVGR
ncbi:MAG: lysophospholipid acyltransferase family protein [Dehalococcoidia bacterium]